MAEAMSDTDLQQHCCCDHQQGENKGHFDLSSVANTVNEICADSSTNQLRNSLLMNGCLKAKLGSNGLKVPERCKDSTCQSENDLCQTSHNSQVCAHNQDCGDVLNAKRVTTTDLQEESVVCSSIESCSKTESDLSDAVASTSISELSGSESGRDLLYGIEYVVYESELQMPDIMRLITKDLSEPYSIYTYRYFIHNWPKLCFLAMDGDKCVGAIVCKLDLHKKMVRRGYIAMLAVDKDYRRRKIGSHLVMKAIRAMISDDCDEVVLETEITNKSALLLYENLGFVRDKRLFRYYLNGVDALRLKLWLR